MISDDMLPKEEGDRRLPLAIARIIPVVPVPRIWSCGCGECGSYVVFGAAPAPLHAKVLHGPEATPGTMLLWVVMTEWFRDGKPELVSFHSREGVEELLKALRAEDLILALRDEADSLAS